jgi:multiple sugar transport system permease protein
MTATTAFNNPTNNRHSRVPRLLKRDAWYLVGMGSAIMIATIIALIYLSPFAYMVLTSLKSDAQVNTTAGDALPTTSVTFLHEGKVLPLYKVPTEQGIQQYALLNSTRNEATFIDPANPSAPPIIVKARIATLEKVRQLELHPETYEIASNEGHMNFSRALVNTLAVALISGFGAIVSAALVAYGFSRFSIPGANVLFLMLMSTIILPPQVTLIPLYIMFTKLGWVGTLLPLIVPHFFANAYNVFLLRQYFMSIPTEMDEAAKIDGANPIQTFLYVIVPQARTAILTVSLFHFVVTWGEYYNALIFTQGNRDAQPLSVALGRFQQLFSFQPNQMMAAAVLTMLVPLFIFFLAQKKFIQGVVITGVDK